MSLPTPYYQDSAVTLYHGDCREILPLLPKVDLVLTDPPYGRGDKWAGGATKKWKLAHNGDNYETIRKWDTHRPDLSWIGDTPAVIWGGNYFNLPISSGWLIWDKTIRKFSSSHCEIAWTSIDQPIRAFSYSHGQLAHEGKFHPTQKPLPLILWCLSFFPGAGLILDPFAGSGTTLVAAKQLGRKAIGIEIEEKYCAIAVKRLRQEILL